MATIAWGGATRIPSANGTRSRIAPPWEGERRGGLDTSGGHCGLNVKCDILISRFMDTPPIDSSETNRLSRLLRTIVTASVCAALLAPPRAGAQLPPQDGASGVVGFGDQGVYDYFVAIRDPIIRTYLNLANSRHAGEHVWNLYRAGIYAEPLGDCRYVLQRFPNHPRALQLMTEIAKATDQTSIPIEYFETALKRYPQYAFTRAQYGRYLIDIGVANAGIRELEEALRLEPNQIQARAWLAEARPGAGPAPSAAGGAAKAKGSP